MTSGTAYQRLKGARKTLLENLACLRSAEGCFPKWRDALDSVNHVCHKWWPPGHFPGGIDGIPAQTDVDKLRAELVQLVEDLQLRPPTLRVVEVRNALEAMETDADGGECRLRRSPATKEADADGGDGGCRWNGGGGVEADADGKEAMALRKGFSPCGTIECRELVASAFVDSSSCSRMKRSKRKAVEDHFDVPCANKKASSPFRLVDLDGHICLQDRNFTDNLLKKHIVFFMEILLRFLPLGRIKHGQTGSTGRWELPSKAQIMEFHRSYATEIHELLGGRYELWRWRKVFIKWLNKKIPEVGPNEFNGDNFYMTPAEIERGVTEAVYHYGMLRMGNA